MKPYRRVDLRLGTTIVHGVVLADTHMLRLVGLGAPGVRAMLLKARSIHTATMRRPITVIEIGPERRVVSVRIVPPRRVVWTRDAGCLLELVGPPPPVPVGAPVVALASGPWLENDQVR